MGTQQNNNDVKAKSPLVTVSILSYNDERSIETAVKSAALQLYPSVEIIVLNNNSKDGSRTILENLKDRIETLRKLHLRDHGIENEVFRYHVLDSKENLGFAKGHNKIISISQGEYVLMLNSDAGLDDRFLTQALPCFDDQLVCAVQGKLYRYDPGTEEPCIDPKTGSKIIDTAGLQMLRNRRIINRGQGSADEGQFDAQEEIFGADGAAPLYRRKALDDVKICLGTRCEYLDDDFFAYKEDVDMAWRLRLAGWKTIYEPSTIGYHQRSSGESAAKSYIGIIAERRKLSKFAKYLAFKNQRLMQIKNELPSLLLKDALYWLPKEIGSWGYVMLFERYTWKAIGDVFRLLPKMLRKRRMIMNNKKVDSKQMKRWFV
jgi:GT2 family glycosyltransferase